MMHGHAMTPRTPLDDSPSPRRSQIANEIRPVLSKFSAPVPAVLEIPSKEHPYDASKDSILQRVRNMLGTA